MTGDSDQLDPSKMFGEWIKKSGKAQTEFMKSFSEMMQNQSNNNFDPLAVLKEMSSHATQAQSRFLNNFLPNNPQNPNTMGILNPIQFMPQFLSWGTYKTSVGTNGRISIPEAEREALGIDEGDLVQVVIVPIEKKSKSAKSQKKK